MINFDQIDFGFGNLTADSLRDSQGRSPMDPGYGTDAAADSSPVYAGGTPRDIFDGSTTDGSTGGGGTGGGGGTNVVYGGGGTGGDGGGTIPKSKTPEEIAAEAKKTDAKIVLQNALKKYNLYDSLSKVVDDLWDSGQLEDANEDRFVFLIKDTQAFKDRFVGNVGRVAAGFLELSPSEYLDLEGSYKDILRANGLPASFYDSEDDFAKLIGGTVSVSELQSRIVDGFNAVQNADPEVKRQMKELYGVSDADLAAYFIDPTRMRPLLVAADYKRQAQAAKIAARASESAGIQLTGGLAEDLARRGITETEAETGFTAIGKLGELTTQLSGETALSQEQIIGQQFGIDVAAAQELEKRRRRRVGEFAGGGGFTRTQGETSGAITTAVGKAQ